MTSEGLAPSCNAEIAEWVRGISKQEPYGRKTFYHTRQWAAKRKEILRRDHYACQECRSRGRYARATTVHHVKHLDSNPELALDDGNLVSVCRECHERIHARKRLLGEKFPERW